MILIGFDQFTGLIFKRYLSRVIAGFGDVLLGIAQQIGSQIVVWTLAITGLCLLFGLLILFSVRFIKSEDTLVDSSSENTKTDTSEKSKKKKYIPETLEEIEEKESKLEKGKKD